MEDLSRKISELLGDPQTMEQIRGLAGMLGQSAPSSEAAPPPAEKSTAVSDTPPVSGIPDANMLGMVMKLAPLFQSFRDEDESTRLLRALKPFMHEERAKRIDGAIRLLHIMKILPLLKGSGIDLFSA